MWFIGILFVAALLVAFWYARKAFVNWYSDEDSAPSTGFSMGDLRAMRKQGKISEEEFERAKAMVIDSAKRAAAAPVPKKPLTGFQAKGVGFTGGFPVEPVDPPHDQKPE
jgi:hypothetical protein